MSSISPKKKFGQNFLKNSETALQIVNFLELKNCKTILEIGPGMGALTKHILNIDDFQISSKKDNLFELIMIRLEEMKIYKKSLKKIIESAKKKPTLLSRISNNVMNTMDFYLELTSCYNDTPIDFLKKNTLFFIYSFAFRIWLKDETDDLASTMAELDRLLTMSEMAEKKIKNFFPI